MCCERQHAVPRAILCDLELISNRNFRKFKIFRSKSRDIAPKSMPLCDTHLHYEPKRSLTCVAIVSMLCRMRFRAIWN